MKETIPVETVCTAGSRIVSHERFQADSLMRRMVRPRPWRGEGLQRKLAYAGCGEGSFCFCHLSLVTRLPLVPGAGGSGVNL